MEGLQEYADSNEAFFRDWVTQFQEMSLLGGSSSPGLILAVQSAESIASITDTDDSCA